MKHRPMLFKRVKGKPLGEQREVIGLIGTHHGVGVTHTALMLAFYMGEEKRKRTALLECNSHKDLKLVQEAYDWSYEGTDSFHFHKITCVKEVAMNRISEFYGDDFECLILDFGVDFSICKDELLRCTTIIVVGGGSEWDRAKLMNFVNVTDGLRGSITWLYFIPHADDRIINKVSKVIKRRVYAVPWMAEPTLPCVRSYKFFKQIF